MEVMSRLQVIFREALSCQLGGSSSGGNEVRLTIMKEGESKADGRLHHNHQLEQTHASTDSLEPTKAQ